MLSYEKINYPSKLKTVEKKSRIRDTPNLSTNVDSSTNIFVSAGVKNGDQSCSGKSGKPLSLINSAQTNQAIRQTKEIREESTLTSMTPIPLTSPELPLRQK